MRSRLVDDVPSKLLSEQGKELLLLNLAELPLCRSRALGYVSSHEGVWLTTSDEIAEHYVKTAA